MTTPKMTLERFRELIIKHKMDTNGLSPRYVTLSPDALYELQQDCLLNMVLSRAYYNKSNRKEIMLDGIRVQSAGYRQFFNYDGAACLDPEYIIRH